MSKYKGKVIVAMSGGVDSSVAALILKNQGYDVIGITMRLWNEPTETSTKSLKICCGISDIEDARQVCQILDIPHYVMNFEKEFKKHVIDYFCNSYLNGKTPHPCLACNDKIKFDFLLRRAMFLDAKYIATGHYASIKNQNNSHKLFRATDLTKDQSYVLFTLTQKELSKLLFPLGDYTKQEIRQLASNANLPVADKPDSQEICFIPDQDYKKFITMRSPTSPGNFIDKKGNILGKHNGIHYFTIGQRRKLGLTNNTPNPLYVTYIDSNTNEVVLGPESDLYKRTVHAENFNFISINPPKDEPIRISAKIRYKSSESPGYLYTKKSSVSIKFDQPQKSITPGQAIVFYNQNEVIGGGIIK